jgi:hypothetical protein
MLRKNVLLFAGILLMIAIMLAGGGCGGGSGGSSPDGPSPDLPGEPADFADITSWWDVSALDAKADAAVNAAGADSIPNEYYEDGIGKDIVKALGGTYTALFERGLYEEDAGEPGDFTVSIPAGLWDKVKNDPDFTDIYGNVNPAKTRGSAWLSIELDDTESADEKLLTVNIEALRDGEGNDASENLPIDGLYEIPLKQTAPGKFEINQDIDEDDGLEDGFLVKVKIDLTINKNIETLEYEDGTIYSQRRVLNILLNGTAAVSYNGNNIGEVELKNIVLIVKELAG